ncbi:MAG: phenylalanine--tRNA ligase subunit beta [Hydrogenophaga sp.]|uniref:phenylalanine--tRNA ligase subunit beta n=1 Tax=Hydrogenophaga sp. TaxID=1904254 RepID=UPI0027239BB5|nr:phenylalanine--tRNA ligase subunit beta [Hydrogenophaga sp.]MDO9146490.1 phenylalanine--tRNA ligase subunit beta [Hydrogenophaga sp.]MDO9604430.1 phenylalanine--tRNA ligase subunit beta [Hydrogenophaga sp.]MDP2164316.1 phenylalanine--tRNA ligase subunit beta [Hydrogenophaga sp.]MDP3477755.1 phenylalanine--tRNA ligase subunit beta [Hydrogenophaga sp.]
MQFPESWLRTFCNPPLTSQQLADTLTMAGLEVEGLEPVAPPFTGVVVGRIVDAVQHPNADRLRVCQVDVGQEQPLSIVCGAPNARVGILVPCATVGAVLPPGEDGKPFEIKLGKLRGVESQGMLCSSKELQLADDHGGLLELAPDAVVGRDIRAQLLLDDMLFTLKLTPNLAHCLSVYGIAREVSALTGTPLVEPEFPPVPVSLDHRLRVSVQEPELCGRFTGRIVRGVNTRATTPAWMVDRLARCGQRSVSPLVDISNYVMFELGRPSHIFDLDKIHGDLQVRWGREGEQLKLLNGNTVTVDAQVGVIADDQSVESLAGIMGGDATAVSDETKNIFIEAAFWWPKAIAGRSRRFNFTTDAGHRFERGVDPSTTVEHVERITQLVLDICGGQAAMLDDQTINMPQARPVTLRVARAVKVIGMPLTQAQCAGALRRLGLDLVEGEGTLTVTPPAYRFDLQIEEDLIEEVARVIGYEQLPHTPPQAPITAKIRPEALRGAFAVRHHLAQLGYQETINFSFVDERWERELAGNADPIKLLNPIASQMSVMRSSLLGSLVSVLKFNLDRRADRVRLFELGRVFRKDFSVQDSDTSVAGFEQPMRVAGLCFGPLDTLQWGLSERMVDFFDAKGDVQALLAPLRPTFRAAEHPAMHPGRSASVWLGEQCIGHVGELHPRWRQAYDLSHAPLMFELDLNAVLGRPVPVFTGVSRHQAVERDLAIVVKESVTHAAVMDAIHASTSPWLCDVVLFDVYRPKKQTLSEAMASSLAPDEKSLAVRLSLNRDDATLAEKDIEFAVKAVLDSLAQRVSARLRG